jgi:hypothetical protein
MSEDPREALREAFAALGPELADEPAESAAEPVKADETPGSQNY